MGRTSFCGVGGCCDVVGSIAVVDDVVGSIGGIVCGCSGGGGGCAVNFLGCVTLDLIILVIGCEVEDE